MMVMARAEHVCLKAIDDPGRTDLGETRQVSARCPETSRAGLNRFECVLSSNPFNNKIMLTGHDAHGVGGMGSWNVVVLVISVASIEGWWEGAGILVRW